MDGAQRRAMRQGWRAAPSALRASGANGDARRGSFRPLVRGRGHRNAMSLPVLASFLWTLDASALQIMACHSALILLALPRVDTVQLTAFLRAD